MLSIQLSTNSTHGELLIPTDFLVHKLNKASFYKPKNCGLKPANVHAYNEAKKYLDCIQQNGLHT